MRLQQLQAREVLRIDNADWHIVVIDNNKIIDAMPLQQVQNFDCEFIAMNRHWI